MQRRTVGARLSAAARGWVGRIRAAAGTLRGANARLSLDKRASPTARRSRPLGTTSGSASSTLLASELLAGIVHHAVGGLTERVDGVGPEGGYGPAQVGLPCREVWPPVTDALCFFEDAASCRGSRARVVNRGREGGCPHPVRAALHLRRAADPVGTRRHDWDTRARSSPNRQNRLEPGVDLYKNWPCPVSRRLPPRAHSARLHEGRPRNRDPDRRDPRPGRRARARGRARRCRGRLALG